MFECRLDGASREPRILLNAAEPLFGGRENYFLVAKKACRTLMECVADAQGPPGHRCPRLRRLNSCVTRRPRSDLKRSPAELLCIAIDGRRSSAARRCRRDIFMLPFR